MHFCNMDISSSFGLAALLPSAEGNTRKAHEQRTYFFEHLFQPYGVMLFGTVFALSKAMRPCEDALQVVGCHIVKAHILQGRIQA